MDGRGCWLWRNHTLTHANTWGAGEGTTDDTLRTRDANQRAYTALQADLEGRLAGFTEVLGASRNAMLSVVGKCKQQCAQAQVAFVGGGTAAFAWHDDRVARTHALATAADTLGAIMTYMASRGRMEPWSRGFSSSSTP